MRDLRFAIIGAGMSGLLCGIKLKEVGLTDFTIYEKADTHGGTWRDNRYPGLSCDVPSQVYRYSFEPNPDWSHRFSPGQEIWQYLDHVAKKHGLESHIRFNSEVDCCEFRDHKWHLTTTDGHADVVDIVLSAVGVLHHPFYPNIQGLTDFLGPCFHSARWDDSVDLAGKRIGIIGTGSTAIQMVSALVDKVAELVLFQRTAQWVFPQENPAFSEDEKKRFREDPGVLQQMYEEGVAATRIFANAVVDADSEVMQTIQQTCEEHLETQVKDPDLRSRLTPDHRAGCKRLVMSGNFYESIQKPNARLVTDAIACIEESGIRTADGQLIELDILVLATGFKAHDFMRPMKVRVANGPDIETTWAKRVTAYRSVSIPGFPNFFMLIGPASPVGNFSLIDIAEVQFNYIMQLIELIRDGTCLEIAARKDATERFNQAMADATSNTIWVTGCRSWYLDDDGIPASWPWSMEKFNQEMQSPDLRDMDITA
jgi:cation diffusion facilitator CzcD-associated flavoprotein CzcO